MAGKKLGAVEVNSGLGGREAGCLEKLPCAFVGRALPCWSSKQLYKEVLVTITPRKLSDLQTVPFNGMTRPWPPGFETQQSCQQRGVEASQEMVSPRALPELGDEITAGSPSLVQCFSLIHWLQTQRSPWPL